MDENSHYEVLWEFKRRRDFFQFNLKIDLTHLLRMAIIKKESTSVGKDVEKFGTIMHCCDGTGTVKNILAVSQKVKQLLYNPAIPFPSTYTREL